MIKNIIIITCLILSLSFSSFSIAGTSSTSLAPGNVSTVQPPKVGYVLVSNASAWYFCGCVEKDYCSGSDTVCNHNITDTQCLPGYRAVASVAPLYTENYKKCWMRGYKIQNPKAYPSGSGYGVSVDQAYANMFSCNNQPVVLGIEISCVPT